MEVELRNEEMQDTEQVRKILCAAFPSELESKLVDMLRANGKAIISLVATHEGQVLGHILFSPVTTSPPSEAKGIGLAPVAVRPDVQSQGIGSQLIREGLRRCKELGYDYCVVLGNPNYYPRFGFETASQFDIQNEYGVDHEFMLIHFSKHGILQGMVKYAPEFAALSL